MPIPMCGIDIPMECQWIIDRFGGFGLTISSMALLVLPNPHMSRSLSPNTKNMPMAKQ